MSRKSTFLATLLFFGGVIFSACSSETDSGSESPNIIVLFTDDQGYADVEPLGADLDYETPHLNQMAAEGMTLSSFYVSTPVCAPSRYSLMTGTYAGRTYTRAGRSADAEPNAKLMSEIDRTEVHPKDWEYIQETLEDEPNARLARNVWGYPDGLVTMAEMLKGAGYQTVMYGKWHGGALPRFYPVEHGFDHYWGAPTSLDIRPGFDLFPPGSPLHFPNLPILEDDSIVGFNPEPDQFRQRYTRRATDYIRRHDGESPFFMYLAYHMPHVPLGVSAPFRDTTGRGLYHDVIREIDWSVGQILRTLREQGLDENTLVIFTSDNGPWLRYGPHGGSAKPLRGGKNSYFEGGVRVPTFAWWPGTIPAGTTNDHPAMTIDLYPTFAELAGAPLPDYPIDGENIFPMLTDPGTSSPQDAYYFFGVNNVPGYHGLRGVRMGKWKLYFPHSFPVLPENASWPTPGKAIPTNRDSIGLTLFNLQRDIGERKDLADEHPDIVQKLRSKADSFATEMEEHQIGVRYVTHEEADSAYAHYYE